MTLDDLHDPFCLDELPDSSGAFALFHAAPRVLHVDCDDNAALVLATLLVPENHVTHAATLAEAEQAIRRERFALVVLDPDLPDGDGAALLAALRRSQSDARVLLYSARSPEPDAHGAAFLSKPSTSPRQLWAAVSQLLPATA